MNESTQNVKHIGAAEFETEAEKAASPAVALSSVRHSWFIKARGKPACNLSRLRGSVIGETKKVDVMNNMIELTEGNFETEVIQAAVPVVVDFYAPRCGPCKMLAPVLEQLAGEFAGRLKFAKANVDETPDLAANFEVSGVPTLMLFRGGEAVDQLVGFSGLRQLKGWLDTAANTAVTT